MCVYEKPYNDAYNQLNSAKAKIDIYYKDIEYFVKWKEKVVDCLQFSGELESKTRNISEMCQEIILNGKPIDEGENHYPTGNAKLFATKIHTIYSALNRFVNEINESLDTLNVNLTKQRNLYETAEYKLKNTPKPPCGFCEECKSEISSDSSSTQLSTTSSQTPPAPTKTVSAGSTNLTV